jgi:CHASE1-domain containing sensor protein
MLRGAAVAVVVLGMVVSGLVANGWQSTVVRQRHERLDRAAASRTATIEGVMANYENALQAARSLWVASDSVSRNEFNNFARSLDLPERYPGLQGIGWRSLVTDAHRAAFLAKARADEPGFTIRPAGGRSTTSTSTATRASPPARPWGRTPAPSPASWPPSTRPGTAGRPP